ncbi:MAG: lamin tail domain-containing protein [Phycisphaerae bacterium]|nr:lamin tail domain-containing protein [Phycisphaerae bacterium]
MVGIKPWLVCVFSALFLTLAPSLIPPCSGSEGETTLDLVTRHSYLPDIPVLVRIDLVTEDLQVDTSIWNGTVILETDNPSVHLNPSQVVLFNGRGSALVRISGPGGFTLSAAFNDLTDTQTLTDLSQVPVQQVSGALTDIETTWSGVVHVTDDVLVPQGHTLTIQPGTLVLINGTSTPLDETGKDIRVNGTLLAPGTREDPITLTAADPAAPWGQVYHDQASPSLYQYVQITRAGHAPHQGHTAKGPAMRVTNAHVTLDHVSITDIAGKTLYATGSELAFTHCLLSRSVMGPEIQGTALHFEDSHILNMLGLYREDNITDDNDGIYLHNQQTGQSIVLTRSVIAQGDDDGIDTADATVSLRECIIRDFGDKGISVSGGSTTVEGALITGNDIGIETKVGQASTRLDHVTIVDNARAVRLMSSGRSLVITNSIIRGLTTSVFSENPANSVVTFSNLGHAWPGQGNIQDDPLFVDASAGDYRLQAGSVCINAGDPAAPLDPDGSVTDQGYYVTLEVPPSDPYALTEDTVWDASGNPYQITSDLTVPQGITVTLREGVIVHFAPNARMTIQGRLQALGTADAPIQFTRRPGASGFWGGLQFKNTRQDNRLTHCRLEYGQTNDGMIGVENTTLLLDHCTFDHTGLRRIRTIDSALTVRHCVFTDMFGPNERPLTDNMSEHIWGHGVPSDGSFVVEYSVFGKLKGHNDGIDFDGPTRPRSIPQILNNVFMGGGDDALDLESDAHIEGNLFMNFIKDQYNTASGESNVISAGHGQHYVMVRNVFKNVEHVAQVKDGAYLTFVNNTVIHASAPAIYFDLDLPGRGPGRGAFIDGCLFDDAPWILAGVIEETDLEIHHSVLPAVWHAYGQGNYEADPLLTAPDQNDYSLLTDSIGRGTGPWGLDMGAMVPEGVALCGEPAPVTYRTEATLEVGGPGITQYQYCLNDPSGPWSDILDVNQPIELTDLQDGHSYTVYALGKNTAGIWQTEPTASRTWTVDRGFYQLVINEILADNVSAVSHEGTFPDMIELYYDGPADLNLGGLRLGNTLNESDTFVFQSGLILTPGQYLVIYADNHETSGLHTGFALDRDGDSVTLFSAANELIDSVTFGPQLPDVSLGRIGTDQHWTLTAPTFGSDNVPEPLGNPMAVVINEWLTQPDVLFNTGFVELYNTHASPVHTDGLFLTLNHSVDPATTPMPPLSYVGVQGYVVIDENAQIQPLTGPGSVITLNSFEGEVVDSVTTSAALPADVSEGRSPDGADLIRILDRVTPGLPNPGIGLIINTPLVLVPQDSDKRILIPTGPNDANVLWRSLPDFDDLVWLNGSGAPGGVGYEFGSGYENLISLDVLDLMYNQATDCLIRQVFDLDAEVLASLTALRFQIRFDDAFVAYLNGVEIARSHFVGEPQWNSTSNSNHEASSSGFDLDLDVTEFLDVLTPGRNLLAIHGINANRTSSDFLILSELEGTTTEIIPE